MHDMSGATSVKVLRLKTKRSIMKQRTKEDELESGMTLKVRSIKVSKSDERRVVEVRDNGLIDG